MNRKRSRFKKEHSISVPGILGTFSVPNTELRVEYVLTYASMEEDEGTHGQLLKHLAPVREVFRLEDLDFDQLLQRDLDDFRVSHEMVPYLKGEGKGAPRFFPPIVAVIAPKGDDVHPIAKHYPAVSKTEETLGTGAETYLLYKEKYGNVFSIEREKDPATTELSRCPVDLTIFPNQCDLIIVDGQHRAMAMLATYRAKSSSWNDEFRYFYDEYEDEGNDLKLTHLPVCLLYFPDLVEGRKAVEDITLSNACRRLFLDVNRTARQPSESRQVLLDDLDLAAVLTRATFSEIKKDKRPLKLYHTEYDNPRNRTKIGRRFAITDVFTISNVVKHLLMYPEANVRKLNFSTVTNVQNPLRLQSELELKDKIPISALEDKGISISDVKRFDFPRVLKGQLEEAYRESWCEVVIETLSKLSPFKLHIDSVNEVLEKHSLPMGPERVALVALKEGQGLRFTLKDLAEHHSHVDGRTESDAISAWRMLREIENRMELVRASEYFGEEQDSMEPEILQKASRLYQCFRSNAFQTGLFMAFAYLKARAGLDKKEFNEVFPTWLVTLNERFTDKEISEKLFDYGEFSSLRRIYKPTGGLIPSDWVFFRYVFVELLEGCVEKSKELIVEDISLARKSVLSRYLKWKRKQFEEDVDINDLYKETYEEVVLAYELSLGIDEELLQLAQGDLDYAERLTVDDESFEEME